MVDAAKSVVVDALGRTFSPGEARRVVSLVPSETESVAALAGLDRLVGRTIYCEEPRGAIEAVPTVGGTKKVDREAIVRLAPDLVLANQEESSRGDVEALLAAGLNVHVSFPCTVEASVRHLGSLSALLLGSRDTPLVIEAERGLAALQAADPAPTLRVFVPIWRDPWMSFDERTFASDVLAHAGLVNVFAHRARRHPLAADLGEAPAVVVDASRDTRYPRFRLEEALARRPDVVLLPDEPYRFGAVEADEIRALADAPLRILHVDGKDLFWYGARAVTAPARLRALAFG